jgi:hypothetical protein
MSEHVVVPVPNKRWFSKTVVDGVWGNLDSHIATTSRSWATHAKVATALRNVSLVATALSRLRAYRERL